MIGMQFQLFSDLPLPPRPKLFSDEVTLELLDRILPKVIAWIESDRKFGVSASEAEEVREDLMSAIDFEDSSYKIARSLDDLGWSIDDELQDILKEVSQVRWDSWKINVRDWVLKNGLEPKFECGAEVSINLKGKTKVGQVSKIYPDTAEYCVFLPGEGHVKSGIGTRGIILPFEEVTPND